VKRVKVLTVLSLFVLGLFVVMALGSGTDDDLPRNRKSLKKLRSMSRMKNRKQRKRWPNRSLNRQKRNRFLIPSSIPAAVMM